MLSGSWRYLPARRHVVSPSCRFTCMDTVPLHTTVHHRRSPCKLMHADHACTLAKACSVQWCLPDETSSSAPEEPFVHAAGAVTVWTVPSHLRPLASGLSTVMPHLLGDVPILPITGWIQSAPPLPGMVVLKATGHTQPEYATMCSMPLLSCSVQCVCLCS